MSSPAETRILFVGDMHLGRLPTSLPADLPAPDLGPRRAWSRVLEAAAKHQVHCVALAGDLVNQNNDLFEAYGLLDEGIRQLTALGIHVCAVAGNHDTRTLPDLADKIEDFHLLGRQGTWETFTVDSGAGPTVRLAGWSFPGSHHPNSPVLDGPPEPEPGLITLGLLHADLDTGSSKYAPVFRAELINCGYQGWYLGHVHLPGAVPDDGSPFYLGSVSGLTPNEQGMHGPVLVTVNAEGEIAGRRLPLAPLRWEELAVDCTGLTSPRETLRGRLLEVIRNHGAALEEEMEQVRALGLRLVLTGRVENPRELHLAAAAIALEDLRLEGAGRDTFVQKIINRVEGAFDLLAVAEQDHPAGLLARQILVLRGADGPEREELIRLGRRALEKVDARDAFSSLLQDPEEKTLDDPAIAEILLDAALAALNDLLAGKEGDHAPV